MNEPYEPWTPAVPKGVTLTTSDGRTFTGVREDSLIMAGAHKEFLSFETWNDGIIYVPNVASFTTTTPEV